ncbi:hypothetical protein BpHYR1_034759 [Brachionus plicatilis]|uniref:Uncharacterized protein n=1 Tax=Brachionus plicatilis TaxID=10195 RepID=A0A3M7PG69_BRAPC|nr:hypothetical protein BpHYR1_034759 [Brachionus plicatilis]
MPLNSFGTTGCPFFANKKKMKINKLNIDCHILKFGFFPSICIMMLLQFVLRALAKQMGLKNNFLAAFTKEKITSLSYTII